MMRKTLAWALGLLLVVLLGAAAVGALYLHQKSLPVYVVGELPPSEGYANNTLALGNLTYVSGKPEFRLRPLDEPFGPAWAIGRTVGDWQIFRPKGQAGGDYIYVTGDMMPQMVYRDGRLPPLELQDMRVREIRAAGVSGPGSTRTSRDPQLIGEVMAALAAGQSIVLHPDYDAGDRGFRLDLLPEQAPGLAYMVDTLVDHEGRAYLSTQTELGEGAWVPAGELFTRWVRP